MDRSIRYRICAGCVVTLNAASSSAIEENLISHSLGEVEEERMVVFKKECTAKRQGGGKGSRGRSEFVWCGKAMRRE